MKRDSKGGIGRENKKQNKKGEGKRWLIIVLQARGQTTPSYLSY